MMGMGNLRAVHEAMVDVRDDLAVLILHGRAHHHEHHRATAPGLFVDLFDVGAERDLVARANRRYELDILTGIEAGGAETRHVSKEMAPVAERDGERGRRDD